MGTGYLGQARRVLRFDATRLAGDGPEEPRVFGPRRLVVLRLIALCLAVLRLAVLRLVAVRLAVVRLVALLLVAPRRAARTSP